MAATSVLRPCVLVLCILCGLLPNLSLATNTCPVMCTCLGDNVDCVELDLTSVPTDLPSWTAKLSLANNKITSLADDAFANLLNLQEINLSQNELASLNGSVFAGLPELKKIKLAYNQLTSFPELPVSLPGVTELVLNHNSLESLPQAVLDSLPNLRLLNVNYNRIQSIRNSTFSLHPHLHQLYLNNNKISSVAPNAFSNLTNLEWLKLTRNKISRLPKETFSKLGRLVVLELSKNELRSIDGLMFKGLERLETLQLKRNHISNLMDAAFYGLTALTNLHLDHNNISAVRKGWLYGLDSLQTLSLAHNSVESIEEEAWDDRTHLSELDLMHNRLRSIDMPTFTGLTSLKSLYLDYNHITSIADEAFAQLHSLDRLFLNHNELSWTLEELTGAFTGLGSLTRLGLAHNQVRSVAARAFQSLEALRQLHLEDNPLTAIHSDAFPASLTSLKLNSSAFLCDCHLSWLGEWLRKKGFGEDDVTARCAYPEPLRGRSVMDVAPDSFQCVSIPKPVLVRQPSTQKTLKGSNLTLVCEAASTQAAMTPVWKRDNEVLSGVGPDGTITNLESAEGENGTAGATVTLVSTLHIENITDLHRGVYQCVVSNSLGTTYSNKAEISVHVFPKFLRTPENVTVKAGSKAVLACEASGEPKPSIVLQKVGGDDFPAARERRMDVTPPDIYSIKDVKSTDQGVYSCMATNDAGTVVANATLKVLEVPHFSPEAVMKDMEVRLGQTAVIKCRVAGNPLPRITWFKDGIALSTHTTPLTSVRHFLTGDDQLLVVVETEPSDAGEYECVAANTLGETHGISYLEVRGKKAESGGGMNHSTTTGIIIIAVVCCIVGTSLVWVIIIYHTRKKRADDEADKDGPGMLSPGPYQSYSEVIPVGGAFTGLYGAESQTVPLTGDDDYGNGSRQHNGWSRHHPHPRRHSDSASSHSTQSTRSTGLLSTFHPGTLLPHHSTLLLTYDTPNAGSPGQYMDEQRGEDGQYLEQPTRGEGGQYMEHPIEVLEQQREGGQYREQQPSRGEGGQYVEQPTRGEGAQCIEQQRGDGRCTEQPPQESDRLLDKPQQKEQTIAGSNHDPLRTALMDECRENTGPSVAIVHALQHPPPSEEKEEEADLTSTFPASSQQVPQPVVSSSSSQPGNVVSSPSPVPHPSSHTPVTDSTCQGVTVEGSGALCDTNNTTNKPPSDSDDVTIICDSTNSSSRKNEPHTTSWLANGSIANGGVIANGHVVASGLREPPTGVLEACVS